MADSGLPPDGMQLVQTTERVSRKAKVPVPKHPAGNCHGYVANPCDIATAATAGGFEASGVRPPPAQPTGA
jgi:gamma-glutamyl phosphate reductase